MSDDMIDSDDYGLDLDTKILSQVVFALNIARRQVATYPADHPAVAPALGRFLNTLCDLLEFQDELTIGVARNTLLVGPGLLDRKNAVYRDLAEKLFSAEIAAVSFHRDLTADELQVFLAALALQPEDLRRSGGFQHALAAAGVTHLEVRTIDYGAFVPAEVETLTETDAEAERDQGDLIWLHLIDGLLAGDLVTGDAPASSPARIAPERLAELVNQRDNRQGSDTGEDYDRTITSYLQQLDREELDKRARMDSFAKLAEFIQRLDPSIRRQFLNSTFRSLGDREDLANQVLGAISGDMLLEFLNDVDDPRLSVPPVIVNLIGKLAEHQGPDPEKRRVTPRQGYSEGDLRQRIRTLFREDRSVQFLSSDYQAFLQSALNTPPALELDPQLAGELMETMQGHQLETRFCSIILELVDADPLCDDADVLQLNLVELIRYFLETGDFPALRATHRRLKRHFDESEPFSVPLAREALAAYAEPDFVAEVIRGFSDWERSKHEQIRALVSDVGAPFVDPLLDHLAEEGNMYLRQYYLLCLQDLGPAIRDSVVRRLRDDRWYVVRNLVILLRHLNDRSVLPSIGHLFNHSQPQVQREVLQTLLHYEEPRAVRYLLKELAENDLRRRLNAVLLAARCHDREVIHRLLSLLEEGVAERTFDLQRTVIRTLGTIADPVALPRLEDLLERKSLLHPVLQRRLKAEIVRSIPKYPGGERLLRHLADRGNADVARLAADLGTGGKKTTS